MPEDMFQVQFCHAVELDFNDSIDKGLLHPAGIPCLHYSSLTLGAGAALVLEGSTLAGWTAQHLPHMYHHMRTGRPGSMDASQFCAWRTRTYECFCAKLAGINFF